MHQEQLYTAISPVLLLDDVEQLLSTFITKEGMLSNKTRTIFVPEMVLERS